MLNIVGVSEELFFSVSLLIRIDRIDNATITKMAIVVNLFTVLSVGILSLAEESKIYDIKSF